jgi:hypothetical protein
MKSGSRFLVRFQSWFEHVAEVLKPSAASYATLLPKALAFSLVESFQWD